MKRSEYVASIDDDGDHELSPEALFRALVPDYIRRNKNKAEDGWGFEVEHDEQPKRRGKQPTNGHTVEAVAEIFGVGVATVRQWIQAGELRASNTSRSARSKKPRWRISEEALAEFRSAREGGPRSMKRTTTRKRRTADANVIQFYK